MRLTGRGRMCAIACAVALLGCAPGARASDTGGGCARTFTASAANCRVTFTGVPIAIFAEGSGSGTVTVHAWINIDEVDAEASPAETVAMIECSGSGTGYASCDTGVPDETTTVVANAAQLFHVHCWETVTSASGSSGYFKCYTGAGR